MDELRRMRQAIREQRYRISSHANDEIRYEVFGDTIDYRCAYVVCRFLLSGVLLIITAYVEEE